MTGRENLEMVARLFGQDRRDGQGERATRCSSSSACAEAGDRLARTYSGGMRRRLDLGASLVGAPAPAPARRAHHRPRPAQPHRAVGRDPRPRRRRHRRAAHHPVPRRGRPARRPGRDHRPRPRGRRGHARPSSSGGSAATWSRSTCADATDLARGRRDARAAASTRPSRSTRPPGGSASASTPAATASMSAPALDRGRRHRRRGHRAAPAQPRRGLPRPHRRPHRRPAAAHARSGLSPRQKGDPRCHTIAPPPRAPSPDAVAPAGLVREHARR